MHPTKFDLKQPRILVVSDSPADTQGVRDALSSRFVHVHGSDDPEFYWDIFRQVQPETLVLAFRTVEHAHAYRRQLERMVDLRACAAFRSIVLIPNDQARMAFDLCVGQVFDDYVPYWPIPHDGYRLPLSVLQSAWHLETQLQLERTTLAAERMGKMGSYFSGLAREGLQHTQQAQVALDQAEQGLQAASQDLEEDTDETRWPVPPPEVTPFVVPVVPPAASPPPPEPAPSPPRGAGWPQHLEANLGERIYKPLKEVRSAVWQVDQTLREVPEPAVWKLEAQIPPAPQGPLRKTVFLVDDDPFQQKIVAAALQGSPYDLQFELSSRRSLQAILDHPPDLLLIDYTMPDVDGLTLTRRIKSERTLRNIPLLMITGNSDKQVVALCLQAGAQDFVVKPVNRAILLKKIEKALALPLKDHP